MNIVKLLNDRQYNFGPRPLSSRGPIRNRDFIPQSSFEALQICQMLKVDSSDNVDSPPISFSLRDNTLLVSNDIGDVIALDKRNFNEKFLLRAHSSAIFDVKWRPENRNHFLTGSGDRTISLWDIETRSNLLNMNYAHLGSIKSISFFDSNVFASSGRDGLIKLWDLRSTSAAKCGPEFQIQNGHNSQLPSSRSPRTTTKTVRNRRHAPIASANELHNFLPSHVVTCVNFHPTNNNYLYSSGVADSAIKVWDIRRCRREFQYCSKATPVRNYSIKNCKSNHSTNHGFSSFLFNHSRYGPVLYALSTDNNIYAFLNNSSDPVMIFTGSITNHFTKFTSFGEDYLICGSKNGQVCIWNCTTRLPSVDTQENRISIEKLYPIYSLPFDEMFGSCVEMSLVCVDYPHKEIIFGCENQALFKCDFFKSKHRQSRTNFQLQCVRYERRQETNDENVSPNNVVNINLKRSSSFNSLTSNIRVPMSKSKQPLLSLTSWIHNTEHNRNTPANEETAKRNAMSTSFKNSKRIVKSRKSRRSLFSSNRKINEYFKH